jgi:Carboxypeptidase regulatory-like domain/Domain of unknown function (DUF4214)
MPRSRVYLTSAALTLFVLTSFATIANAQCLTTNGDFEGGTLTGWTVSTRTQVGNTGGWYNYTGITTPISSHSISAPPLGTRGAVTDQTGPSVHVLYQDVTIPAGASATLSFYFYYNNTLGSFLTPETLEAVSNTNNQQARVDIITTTANVESVAATDVLLKLYQTKAGDPVVLAPTLMSFDLSSLAGQTVRIRFAAAVGLSFFLVGIDNVCLSTTRTTLTRPAPTGSNVVNNFGDLAVTFPTVVTAGITSLQQLDAAAQTGAPAGESFLSPAFDISTTAVYTAPVNVCFTLPAITNPTTFSHLRVLHKPAAVWIDEPTSAINFATKQLCAKVTTLSPFAVGQNLLLPTAAPAAITGKVLTPEGQPLPGVTINLSGAKSRKTITDSNGDYRFDGVETDNFYTVSPSLANHTFSPAEQSFSLLANKTNAVIVGMRYAGSGSVAIEWADYFVRQHYLDFLGREPDEGGFNYWSDQILRCGNDDACRDRQRVNVSAAYFLSIEFQQTGGLVDALYRASFNRRPLFTEFMPDAATVGRDVVVGTPEWTRQLNENKKQFIDEWTRRADFRAAYDALPNEAFVDTLIAHTVGSFNGNRDSLVSRLNSGSLTRAEALREIAENEGFKQAKLNQMFVMMEYFGYLRRDPDEAGYQFWLDKLNQFDGNFERAEMVKAFIVSGEYRSRFTE